MKIRLTLSTISSRKGIPLDLKISIPPRQHKGFNNFVKAVQEKNSEVKIFFEKKNKKNSSIDQLGMFGFFHFIQEDYPLLEKGNKINMKKEINLDINERLFIVFESTSPKKGNPMKIKLRVPFSKKNAFINFVTNAWTKDSLVRLCFERITSNKKALSRVQGFFHLQVD
ncbi:MAG: hypothetical protein ACTSVI_11990 [Promethearchaeota archaeon]